MKYLCEIQFITLSSSDLKLSAIPEYAEHLAKNNVRGVFGKIAIKNNQAL